MPTYLLTWNPKNWNWKELEKTVQRIRRHPQAEVRDQWSCARSHQIKKGDRLFIMKQGREPRGIFGSGWATTDAFKDEPWSDRSQSGFCMYVKLKWDALVDPNAEPILSREELNRRYQNEMNWDVQSSGTRIPDTFADDLESFWAEFLASNFGLSLSARQTEKKLITCEAARCRLRQSRNKRSGRKGCSGSYDDQVQTAGLEGRNSRT
jgi:5-methylcytosine-specific restriction protein A